MGRSELSADPRDKTNLHPLSVRPKEEEMPADFMALLSLMFGMIGLMMKYKWASWLALFSGLGSVANMRSADLDLKHVFATTMFTVVGLIMNYFGPQARRVASGASAQ